MTLFRVLLLIGLLPGVLLPCPPVAAEELALYEGETTVSSQQPGERAAALPRALAHVLVKLSGDRAIASDPAIRDALDQAGQLMQQYRYRQLDAGSGDRRLALVASFRRAGVDALLAEAGRQAWPEPRPQPMVWLAIDDGRGPRLVGTSQASAVAALTRAAEARGIRLNYPLLDLEDQQAIDAGRVWNFDEAAIAAATGRYPSQTALAGKLYRSGDGWTAEWRLFDRGELIEQARMSNSDAGELLAAGAELAADALASRYANQVVNSGPPGSYTIWVEPIRTGDDYARLIGYLQGLPIVTASQPLRADGDRLRLQLELTTGIDGFSRLVHGAGVLRALPAGNADRARGFELQP